MPPFSVKEQVNKASCIVTRYQQQVVFIMARLSAIF